MGHKSVHIECKNGWWYYRRRIPEDLRSFFPRKQIRTSLKTKSHDDALMLVRLRDAETDKTFALIRSGVLSSRQREQTIASLFPDHRQSITTFEQAIDNYLVDRKPGLSVRTQQDYLYFADVLKVKFNKKVLCEISRNDLLGYREVLSESRAPATVNKYLSWLQSFFCWCVKTQLLTNNPAVDITRIKDDARRDRFTPDELQQMYSLILKYKHNNEYPQRYWVPLISLFMGLRLTEALQLERADVVKKDNVWCVSVNSKDGKSIKTKSSERFVPIHPVLLEIGLLEYTSHHVGRLWPISLSNKRPSNAFSCWFSRRVKPLITQQSGKTFHSLRHTFVDELKQSGVEEQIIAELVGHSRGSITMERYGKKYLPKIMYEQLIKIKAQKLLGINDSCECLQIKESG